MLTNPYYKGQIAYKGALYDGAHEPLVDEVVWQRVQDVLAGRRIAGDRSWRHSHYLKGQLRCARCDGRIGYATAKGRGGEYDYFFCIGRHTGRTACDLPYLGVSDVEDAVARQWASVRFTDDEIAEFSKQARNDLHRSAESGSRLITDQRRRLAELERNRQKLLDAYMVGALPVDLLKERQTRVAAEIADAKRLMQGAQTASDEVFARLEQVILLLTHAERLYVTVGDEAREILNSAYFGPLKVDSLPEDGVTQAVITDAPLTGPVAAVASLTNAKETPEGLFTTAAPGVATESGRAVPLGGLSPTKGSNLTHLAGFR